MNLTLILRLNMGGYKTPPCLQAGRKRIRDVWSSVMPREDDGGSGKERGLTRHFHCQLEVGASFCFLFFEILVLWSERAAPRPFV